MKKGTKKATGHEAGFDRIAEAMLRSEHDDALREDAARWVRGVEAASVEMLEVLRQALEYVGSDSCLGGRIEAVIAKAEGR